MLHLHRIISLLPLLAALGLAAPAHARDMTGRLGLGGQLETGLLGPTLSVKYWVSNLGLQGLFGFSAQKSGDGEDGYREVRLGARVLYGVTRTRLTNLNVGVGISTFIRDSKDAGQNPLLLDVLIAPEIHLNDNFAVSGQVTFTLEFASSPSRELASGAWGAAFHYYF